MSLYFSRIPSPLAPAPTAGAPPTFDYTAWRRAAATSNPDATLVGKAETLLVRQQEAAKMQADAATAAQADLQSRLDQLEHERALAEAEAAGYEALVPEEGSKLPIVLAVGGVLLLIGIAVAVKGRRSVAGYRKKRRHSRRRR